MSYLTFVDNPPISGRKTLTYDVRSSRDQSLLGRISWYGPWRRFTYSPAGPQVMDAACLREVAEFLDERMAARKAEAI